MGKVLMFVRSSLRERQQPVRVAIVGSRGEHFAERMREAIVAFVYDLPNNATVVSGGAIGVDTIAEEAARRRGLSVDIYKPDYKAFADNPKLAPLARNETIADNADRCVAFWDGKSTGTQNAMNCFYKRNKPVRVVQ